MAGRPADQEADEVGPGEGIERTPLGLERVDVDLNAGGASRVTVISSAPIAAERISAAITEAGYSLSPAS